MLTIIIIKVKYKLVIYNTVNQLAMWNFVNNRLTVQTENCFKVFTSFNPQYLDMLILAIFNFTMALS